MKRLCVIAFAVAVWATSAGVIVPETPEMAGQTAAGAAFTKPVAPASPLAPIPILSDDASILMDSIETQTIKSNNSSAVAIVEEEELLFPHPRLWMVAAHPDQRAETIQLMATVFEVFGGAFGLFYPTVDELERCMDAAGELPIKVRIFSEQVASNNITLALDTLSSIASLLSTSLHNCGVKEIQNKLDTLAVTARWAKVSIKSLSKSVELTEVIIGATNIKDDILQVAKAAEASDYNTLGEALGTLMVHWKSTTGCHDESGKICNFIDGILKWTKMAVDIKQDCTEALRPVVETALDAMHDFSQGNISDKIKGPRKLAEALLMLKEVAEGSACGEGFKPLAKYIGHLPEKLASSVMTLHGGMSVIVGHIDIAAPLYDAFQALHEGDYVGFGMQTGKLLGLLQTSDCKTSACVVLEGILQAINITAPHNFTQCLKTIDPSWQYLEEGFQYMRTGRLIKGMGKLGASIKLMAKAVDACAIPELGETFRQMAHELGMEGVSSQIGGFVIVLVNGRDLTGTFQQLVLDYESKDLTKVGQDLGSIIHAVTNKFHCQSVVCIMAQGLFREGGAFLQEFKDCEGDFGNAGKALIEGANLMIRSKYTPGMRAVSLGLTKTMRGLQKCGKRKYDFLVYEAGVVGLTNFTHATGMATYAALHGEDVTHHIHAIELAFLRRDYQQVGMELKAMMLEANAWTQNYACEDPWCYITIGVMEFFGRFKTSVKKCKEQFKEPERHFKLGYHYLTNATTKGYFIRLNKTSLIEGIHEVSTGVSLLSDGMEDCHIKEIAWILHELAEKLAKPVSVQFSDTLVRILISGVDLEKTIYDAYQAWLVGNYAGFGYAISELVKILL